MTDNDIEVGYPNEISRGRTIYNNKENLSFVVQAIATYNDGGDKTEDSAWTAPDEREYVIPPDRMVNFNPVTEIGTKLLETDGEVTFHDSKMVNADVALDHIDRISQKIAFSNWGAIRGATFFPAPYKYIIIVTDGVATHYYTVEKGTGPVNIIFPDTMTGEQSVAAPTMTIEIIFHDTDLEITEAFVDAGSGTYYYAWKGISVQAWFDVQNTVDEGILGGLGFLANIGLSTLFSTLVSRLTENAQLQAAANVIKAPIEIFGTSIAAAICLGSYYQWIEVDEFIRKGGLGKLINAALNPMSIAGTAIAAGSGAIQNSMTSLLIGKAAGGISSYLTTQAMIAMIDDIHLNVFM
jgi:hypothetical protein